MDCLYKCTRTRGVGLRSNLLGLTKVLFPNAHAFTYNLYTYSDYCFFSNNTTPGQLQQGNYIACKHFLHPNAAPTEPVPRFGNNTFQLSPPSFPAPDIHYQFPTARTPGSGSRWCFQSRIADPGRGSGHEIENQDERPRPLCPAAHPLYSFAFAHGHGHSDGNGNGKESTYFQTSWSPIFSAGWYLSLCAD